MTQKRRLSLIALVLILLVGGWIVVSQKNKKNPTPEQKVFADKFASDMKAVKISTVTGTAESSDAQNLTVRSGKELITVKITKTTIISIIDRTGKATVGQISDVQPKDTVKVEYDKATASAINIIKVKI